MENSQQNKSMEKEKSKLFVFYKIHKKRNQSVLVNDVKHEILIDGYISIDVRLSIIRNVITKTIKLCYFSGPQYCVGTNNKKNCKRVYERYEVPKKYSKEYDKLKLLYNNFIEDYSKTNNVSLPLIF